MTVSLKLKRWQRIGLASLAIVAALELGLMAAGRYVLEKQYAHTNSPVYYEGDINILCLGESSTVGLWVKPEDSYPKQLEAMLQKKFGITAIKAVVPPHIGQNTSQQANRFEDYLERYKPKLVILMSGANNEWAMSESHIGQFLKLGYFDTLLLRLRILADHSRVFKGARHLYRRLAVPETEIDSVDEENKAAVWGHPEKTHWPPDAEISTFATENRPAFVKLWRFDLETMIAAAKKRSIPVIVMSYPITPAYLTVDDFKKLAEQTKSFFVDNDATFTKLREQGYIPAYLQRDGWHPSERGYTVIAENLKAMIDEHRLLDPVLGIGPSK